MNISQKIRKYSLKYSQSLNEKYLIKLKYYLNLHSGQNGGKKKKVSNIIYLPFELISGDINNLEVRWAKGDDSRGKKLPTKDFSDFGDLIERIYFYRDGWGITDIADYIERGEDEPFVLLAKLTNDIYVYMYVLSNEESFSGDVIYSHDLMNLWDNEIGAEISKYMLMNP